MSRSWEGRLHPLCLPLGLLLLAAPLCLLCFLSLRSFAGAHSARGSSWAVFTERESLEAELSSLCS